MQFFGIKTFFKIKFALYYFLENIVYSGKFFLSFNFFNTHIICSNGPKKPEKKLKEPIKLRKPDKRQKCQKKRQKGYKKGYKPNEK
jgi:hypothetical protein